MAWFGTEKLEVGEARDWSYLSEGRHHLLLRYLDSPTPSLSLSLSPSPLRFFVLRIEKVLPQFFSSSSSSSSSSQINETRYREELIDPWISSVFSLFPINISLSREFLFEISQMITPYRPSHRIEPINFENPIASLLPNLLLLPTSLPSLSLSPSHPILSIEFKVKNGLLSVSPFLSSSSLKRKMSKFQFMQFVKISKKLSQEKWKQASQRSQYNPSDLSSLDPIRIYSALKQLEDCPGNNFLVSINGERVFGNDRKDREVIEQAASLLLSSSLPTSSQDNLPFFWKEQLYEVIGRILLQEKALSCLQFIQSLDLLDTEGMTEVWGRYRQLLIENNSIHVSNEKEMERIALDTLQEHLLDPLPIDICRPISLLRVQLNELLNSSLDPFEIRKQAREALAHALPSCSRQNSHVLWRLYSLCLSLMETPDLYAPLSQSFIQTLTEEECVLLLSIWLLSLAASDASAILTLSPSSSLTTQCQTVSECGRLERERVEYRLKLIDMGPKPIEKIIEKIATSQQLEIDARKGFEYYEQIERGVWQVTGCEGYGECR